jgi:septum formation protein
MVDWRNPGIPVILASRSPRRSQILSLMGLTFETMMPDETIPETELLDKKKLTLSLQDLAVRKAVPIASRRPDALVVGADTVVVKDGMILGKPAGADEAFEMLRSLSGSDHKVYTGVALICKALNFTKTAAACTVVYFRKVPEHELRDYLTDNEYRDKAGAYAIQGKAMTFIDKIEGCFYNVMGLPVTETIDLFNAFISRKDRDDA